MTSPLPKNMAIIFSQISINNSHWPVNSQINSQQKHSTVTPPTQSKKKKEIQLKIIATHYYQCFHFGCYKLESRDRIWKSTSCCRTSYSVFCLCGLYCFWAAIFLYTRIRKHIKPKSDPARRFYGRFLTWERVMIMCSVCFRLLFKASCLWPTEGAKWGDRKAGLSVTDLNGQTYGSFGLPYSLHAHTWGKPQVKSRVLERSQSEH